MKHKKSRIMITNFGCCSWCDIKEYMRQCVAIDDKFYELSCYSKDPRCLPCMNPKIMITLVHENKIDGITISFDKFCKLYNIKNKNKLKIDISKHKEDELKK